MTDYALTKLNEELDTRIEVSSARFSLLRRFPRASVELKDLTVWSPEGPDYLSFGDQETDTLLYASSFFLEIPVMEFFRGNYSVSSLTVEHGFANILTDLQGRSNYDMLKKGGGNGGGLDLNIDNIRISGLKVSYTNIADSLQFKGEIVSSRLKGMIAGTDIDLRSEAELTVSRVVYPGRWVEREMAASFNVELFKTEDELQFTKGVFSVAGLSFDIKGVYNSRFKKVDFEIASEKVDIAEFLGLLPEKMIPVLEDYGPQGRIDVTGVVSGFFSGGNVPFYHFDFSLSGGSIIKAGSPVQLRGLNFKGMITNGSSGRKGTEMLVIDEIGGYIGSGDFSGSGTVKNFSRPEIDITLSATIIGTEWYSFLTPRGVNYISGTARLNSRIRGTMAPGSDDLVKRIAGLSPLANVTFSEFSIGFTKENLSLGSVTGNLMLAGGLWSDDLSLIFRDHSFRIAGNITNIFPFALGNEKQLKGTVSAWADIISIEKLLALDTPASDTSALYNPFDMFSLDGEMFADSLRYADFGTGRISATVKVRPDGIGFTNIAAETLGGRVAGSYNLWRSQEGLYMSKGSLALSNIDIKGGFGYFNNFGQTFIVKENIGGKLSGNVSFLFNHKRDFYPDMPTLVADGKYIITNGELVNFEPIKQLGRFIDVKELENIKFSKLENELFIKYSTVTVPRMEIGSSAANIVISGKHYFSNDYEYHLKVRLSDILNKRRKETLGPNKEFGPVEDDGLGRPSILLKITSVGDDFKVAYDAAAAKGEIKQDIKEEKQTLKSILNEEYGWYKSDTTIKKQVPDKPKFRVNWEEGKMVATDTAPPPKEGFLKKIIKK